MRTTTGPSDNVVVVGAGLGGLATAIRLLAAGRNVTVIERESVPGGRAGIWTAAGYQFDTGPTVLTMPGLIEDLFNLLGEQMADSLTLLPLDPLYRTYFPDGSQLDVHADPDAMAAEITSTIGAKEADGYRRFVEFVRRLYDVEMSAFIDRNFDSPLDVMTGDLARLVAMGGFRRLSTKVNTFFGDERTRRAFSFQSMYAGLAPQDALAIYAVIAYMDSVAGVYFPAGGIHSIPVQLAALAQRHGAQFRYKCTATEVVCRGPRALGVRTADGDFIEADVVVLNPDLPVAYRDLLDREPISVRRLQYSPSCALLLAGSSATYTKISHHNIHFGKSWRTTFRELIDEQVVMTDPSFFVTNPTRSDPSLAPPGRETYYVLFPTPNNRAAIDWNTFGPKYAEHMLATLERNGYRDFASSVDVRRLITPADWQDLGMEAGAPFAASHSFGQTGPFRPRNTWGENVVFVGSGTTPGVGVPMVLLSGRLAAQRITG